MKLDDIDRRILHDLQEDGRLTNVEIAKRCNISAPPCLRRVRQLEDAGIIKSYHAVIDPITMGYNVLIFAQVSLKSQNDSDLREFEAAVNTWDQVRECFLMSGGTDFFLKIYAKDWDDYQLFHSNVLGKHHSVQQIQTNIVMRNSKNAPGVPIEAPHIPANTIRSLRVVK
ncbi:MAG: Lrp/AsnC family transcriptional regulator [Alphaproteobacteria bacterium]|nr:Lrp/AsnC family transcriptional regulator [Alphaproteobacteria bacterium]MBX9977437.1 Lrp/AsnC family transcriptional regulator [Alphaproteobacteria bacterium]